MDGQAASLASRMIAFLTERPRQAWTQWEVRRAWRQKRRPFEDETAGARPLSADERPAICPHCAALCPAPPAARAAHCLSCGSHFSLEDTIVSDTCGLRLITRGKVTIHHGGRVDAPQLVCGDLLAFGAVSGSIAASGHAELHGESHSAGSLQASHLLLAPDARWTFHGPIRVRSAEILGHLTGNIDCLGRLRLARTAIITGSVRTAQLSIEPGGQIHGPVSTLPAQG